MRRQRHHKSLSGQTPLSAHFVPWLYAASLVLPIYFLIATAGKSNPEIFNYPFRLPIATYDWGNFVRAWERTQMGNALYNSFVIVGSSLILTLIFALPAAYGIARLGGRAGRALEGVFAAGLMIPGFAALVPSVLLAIALNMFQERTFVVLLFAAGAMPLNVILLAAFMRYVPHELEESALVDGASRFQVLRYVYTPMLGPGIATVSILNFLSFWNEYLFSLVLLGADVRVRTVQVALPTLAGQTETKYGELMAGTIMSLAPVLITYLLLQKKFEQALMGGAVKG